MRLAYAFVLLMLGSPALTASHAADTKPPSGTADQGAPAGRVSDADREQADRHKAPSGDHQQLGVPKTLSERIATFGFPEKFGWPILGMLLAGAAAFGTFTVLQVKRETSKRSRRPDEA
jgi:hypothetical protein